MPTSISPEFIAGSERLTSIIPSSSKGVSDLIKALANIYDNTLAAFGSDKVAKSMVLLYVAQLASCTELNGINDYAALNKKIVNSDNDENNSENIDENIEKIFVYLQRSLEAKGIILLSGVNNIVLQAPYKTGLVVIQVGKVPVEAIEAIKKIESSSKFKKYANTTYGRHIRSE